jgi:alginate O-acetyltransferase complex protein AlgJ
MQQVIQVINGAVALLNSAKIETVVVLTPAKARVYREFLPDDFVFSPEADRRYAGAANELRRPGALVPDLATAFAELRKASPGEKIFYNSDTHWTAWGAENAAIEVAKQMKAALRLPPSDKPGTRLGASVIRVHNNNDLSEVLPPKERAEHPAETYPIRQVLAAKGHAALIEDDTADVVVIGNSYMQPEYNFVPMLSNQLNRPIALFWKVHLVGPYKTMLNYLGSDTFRRQRPRAIVWNFHEIDMEIMPDSQSSWTENAMTGEAFLASVRQALGV